VLGVLMVVTIWWSAWGTRKRVPYLPKAPEGASRLTVLQTLARVWFELTEALKNRGFRWLFGGVLIVFLMVGVDGALNLYMYTYFWEVESSQIVILAIATPVGIMIGAPLTKHLHRLVDKKPGVIWGTAWWAGCQIVPVVLRLQDLFPENGTGALVVTLASIKLVQGIGVVQALVSFPSMVADIVDENELKTGKRQEGIFFGAVSFSSKATSGLGNIVAGVGLDLIAWPRGVAIQTAADVPAQTIINLGVLYGPVVAGFAVVSVWCYTHHKLNRESHAEILVALEARREAAAGSRADTG
jgi:Na+/melibiose symporter-like transporter